MNGPEPPRFHCTEILSMSPPLLSAEQLDALRRYNTPTISNAIELFDVRPRNIWLPPLYDSVPACRSWE